ncbi:uncharacterized protein Z518_01479 [Rhinocladiella mackenziei CBS 650.93]|uniref:Actin-like ATPase domain-containing protein n=1 Tax=Rhinocladiella mackenziei CBS 650.93 TaxID=1442369 RepID=A0A0D2G628_9EURO|nr:uncharacterized protein Z518_01479 [Rhinocladiella mackenziei CBS 650.93]KIX10397.1 hypothetical protein Z518_01479 [Rhinocladiella mackenziei CBS 650.93]
MSSQRTTNREISVHHKIIVGVDYGTTYSGVAFATTNTLSWQDIVLVSKWPGNPDTAWKTPSIIAYASENEKFKFPRNQYGYQVTQAHKQYAWTKLQLEGSIDRTEHDDPLLEHLYGTTFSESPNLPPNKSAKDVVQDYLTEIYHYSMQYLKLRLGAPVVDIFPIECWITMPAIWSDRAQQLTREAALGAGFGSRPRDKVKMISEPEAAALYALKPFLTSAATFPLKVGQHVLVCDCGGGTIDLITYEIVRTEPLVHKEICRGSGGKCGSTFIDRRFLVWMGKTFGDAYFSVDSKKRGPGSTFMRSFDTAKKDFGRKGDEKEQYYVEPIIMNVDNEELYDKEDQTVKIPRDTMKEFFDPGVDTCIKLVEDQASQLKKKTNTQIDRVILVGGFGASPYLNTKLEEWCNRSGIAHFTSPEDCQAAIVKGAVLRGLEGVRPISIIAKRHYGWCWGEPFREGIDDENDAYIDEFDQRKYCADRMHWTVSKGQELDRNFKLNRGVSQTLGSNAKEIASEVSLFSCRLDNAPEHLKTSDVRLEGTIKTRLSLERASRKKVSSQSGKTIYQFSYQVEVDFRSEEGVLAFRSFGNGIEEGMASITFESW